MLNPWFMLVRASVAHVSIRRVARWRSSFVLGTVLLCGMARAQATEASTSPPSVPDQAVPDNGPPTPTPASASPESTAPEVNLRPGAPSQAPALDLCALKPASSASGYQIQRLLLMNPLVDPASEEPEVETNDKGAVLSHPTTLSAIHASEMLRLVFAGEFPMQRLYTAYTLTQPTAALFANRQISAADLTSVSAGDPFAAYSAGCADWIAAPKIERTTATWRKVKSKKTVVDQNGKSHEVEYLAWDFSVGWKIELALFKRDGETFTLYKLLDSSGVEGAFANGSAAEPRNLPFHEYASTWPDAACSIGAPHDGQAGGISACHSVEPKLSALLEPGGLAAAANCANVDDAVGAPMNPIAACAVLSSARAAVKVLQLHAKQDPWGMFAQLLPNDTIALGAREGAKRGDYYVATAPGASEPSGFARIETLGAGGTEGTRSPSQLKFKAGEAPVGSRMTEYPLLGAQLGLRPGVLLLISKGDLDTSVGVGGSITLGYDATSYIPVFDEAWIRGNVGLYRGSAKEKFLILDAGPEATSYLGGGLASVVGLGISALVANRDVNLDGTSRTLSGASAGAVARGSLEYAFSPAWNACFSAELRTGFKSTALKDDALPGVAVNAGPLLGGLASLTFSHTL